MYYDFVCDHCGAVQTVKAPISQGPTIPICWNAYAVANSVANSDPTAQVTMAAHGPMRRLYQHQPRDIVILDATGYHEKAYRGEEVPPGMTQAQVRAIMDVDYAPKLRGRANARRYKTLR